MARSYTVLVTGFGANVNAPYADASKFNPAGLIAASLPASLPPGHNLNTTSADIKILDSVAGGFDSIPAEMGATRNRIRELHAEYQADLWIHLGRGPWDFVTCERFAFRQDFTCSWLTSEEHKGYYLQRDNVGQNAHDLGPNPWANVPVGLNAELDVESIVSDASKVSQTLSTPLEIRQHIEPGPGGCGYCFYESLANCFRMGKKRHVLFLHVPRHLEKENIERARDAVLAIIGASVADLIRQETEPVKDKKQAFGLQR